jgi:hypothetical protein
MSASFTSELPNTTDPDDHGTHRSTDTTCRDTRYSNFTVAQGQHPSNSQVSPMPAPTPWIPLPPAWPEHTKSAMINVIALVHFVLTHVRRTASSLALARLDDMVPSRSSSGS